ncbi:MAG: hypothetical protein IJ094_06140 [Bacilli bacterium]|nr:hypothetical protein [Bacilli bacterium]
MKKKIMLIIVFLMIITLFTGCNSNNSKNRKNSSNKTKETKITEKEKYSEEEYKQLCEKLDYKTIARSPDDYMYKKVYGTGEIIQVVEETEKMATFRINVTPIMNYDNTEISYYEDTIMAIIYNYDMNNRLLENDIIDFWGQSRGNYTYETVLGSSATIPLIQIDYYNLK